MTTKHLLFLAASLAVCMAQESEPLLSEVTSSTSSLGSTSSKPTPAPEPFWGRIYLRHGVMPIQYFRDSFGGPMVDSEVEFVFPADQELNRFGCELLDEDELHGVTTANMSIVLVVDRGECTFEEKSRNAQASGAAGLLVISSDESASRPVAIVDKGEIVIPSVMVRRSAGELLRAAVLDAKTRAFGRLLPMVCTNSPYKCLPRTRGEQRYIDAFMARSGVLMSSDTHQVFGEFLSSTFGGIMPQSTTATGLLVSALLPAAVVCQNSDTEQTPRLDGLVVLIAAGDTALGPLAETNGCSLVDLVTEAQRAGAAVALIVADNNKTVSSHPSVLEDWHGYNVTIFSGVISASTALRLTQQQQISEGAFTIKFELKNEIADAWEHIHQLSVSSAWPQRRDRKEKLLKKLLTTFSLNMGQTEALKSHFLTVAGGSHASWGRLVPAENDGEGPEDVEIPIVKLVDTVVTAPESHEEL